MINRQLVATLCAFLIFIAGAVSVVRSTLVGLPVSPPVRRQLVLVDVQHGVTPGAGESDLEALPAKSPFRSPDLEGTTRDFGEASEASPSQAVVHPVLLGTTHGSSRPTALLQWPDETPQALGLNASRNGYSVESIHKGRAIVRHGDSLVTLTLRGDR